MTIVTPSRLEFPSCIAVMYSILVFRGLILDNSELENTPTSLLFTSHMSFDEARVIVLTYLSLSESFVLPGDSKFELTVGSHSCLMKLRRTLSANPRTYVSISELQVVGTERAMVPEMEEVLLDIQETLYCSDVEHTTSQATKRAEGVVDRDVEMQDESVLAMVCTEPKVKLGLHAIPTGHRVLFGHGGVGDDSFKCVTVGVRTLGLLNIKILRACGVFHKKHGGGRAVLRIPKTKGVLPRPRWLGEDTVLSDDLCVIDHYTSHPSSSPTPVLEQRGYFQLNYSPSSAPNTRISPRSTSDGAEAQMSRIEQAICSDTARGYEEQRLMRLFKSARARLERCLFDVDIEHLGEQLDPETGCPLETRSWLVAAKTPKPPGIRDKNSVIGDGIFFPAIEVASGSDSSMIDEDEILASPLPEYKLNLTCKSLPGRHALVRADRSVGECGSVYEACLDEAVLLGHCVRVSATAGAERNFDVSACLTRFYRSVHPCVPDMKAGDIMLDYEFTVHGRGQLNPVYALLSHLAQSCTVSCFPSHKLITLSRHKGSSVWTRGTDVLHSRMLRTNTIGAFLCAQDHRLATLLARCCNQKPLSSTEVQKHSGLLPRGDEEELLLEAYSRTLGPVFEFETVTSFPSKVTTSLGEWRFLRLRKASSDVKRFPGITVVDGYTIAFASESPLFYLKGEGPLVQKLESVAVIVDSGSLYRTDVLRNEAPDWPDPDIIQTPIKCRPKHTVVEEMFMRSGSRDPLEGSMVDQGSWCSLICTQWTFAKSRGHTRPDQDWESEYPVSECLVSIGPRNASVTSVRWLCGAPPERFCERRPGGTEVRLVDGYAELGRIELDSKMARSKDPLVRQGFDVLCSRVITCPTEKVWSTGLCKVSNHGLSTFDENSTAPAAHLITIVKSEEWYAHPFVSADANVPTESYSGFVFSDMQVSLATEFIHALACVMLSGNVHEELEIKCSKKGVYTYIQRAVAWFAGAAGPFRSRNVTVFTPEAECDTQPWTHTLPADVDVLKSSKTSYIASCKWRCDERPDVKVMLDNSVAIKKVNRFGNLVLHSNSSSVALSQLQREAGLHVTAKTLYGQNSQADNSENELVYIYCYRSLKRFCELRGIPKGIRGPELWSKPIPWSNANPSAFCFKVSELKYRWESGLDNPTQVPVRDLGTVRSEYAQQVHKWRRCASDGKLIPQKARFWHLVDHKDSFERYAEESSVSKSECHSEDSLDASEENKVPDRNQPQIGSRAGTSDSVSLSCEWYDNGATGVMILNSHMAIEFVSSAPAIEGHVFFEPVHNTDCTTLSDVKEDGRLVKFYKPYNYRALAYDLYTVLMYGCGLTPVFTKGSPDFAGDRVLNLVLCTMALSHHLMPMACQACKKVTVVVPGGRSRALELASDINRVVVVTTPHTKRQGVFVTYSFKRLPETLQTETTRALRSGDLPSNRWECPTDFIKDAGTSLFAKLMNRWQYLSKRGDVKHPTSSRDPRWIGLALCLAEWEGQRSIADKLTPGAIESAMRTLNRAR